MLEWNAFSLLAKLAGVLFCAILLAIAIVTEITGNTENRPMCREMGWGVMYIALVGAPAAFILLPASFPMLLEPGQRRDLLLTPMSGGDIVRGLHWGALRPWMICAVIVAPTSLFLLFVGRGLPHENLTSVGLYRDFLFWVVATLYLLTQAVWVFAVMVTWVVGMRNGLVGQVVGILIVFTITPAIWFGLNVLAWALCAATAEPNSDGTLLASQVIGLDHTGRTLQPWFGLLTPLFQLCKFGIAIHLLRGLSSGIRGKLKRLDEVDE